VPVEDESEKVREFDMTALLECLKFKTTRIKGNFKRGFCGNLENPLNLPLIYTYVELLKIYCCVIFFLLRVVTATLKKMEQYILMIQREQ